MEPILAVDDIQGHIAPGFATLHNQMLGIQILDPRDFVARVEQLIPEITSMSDALALRQRRKQHFQQYNTRLPDDTLMMAQAISGSGFAKLGVNISGFVDVKLRQGMYLNASALNDKPGSRSDRSTWQFGTPEAPLDYLFTLGCDDLEKLHQKRQQLLELFADCIAVTYDELCSRLPNDIEHFGFKDGLSQPAVRGKINDTDFFASRYIDPADARSTTFARPGQPLIWPGQFLFGYPTQSKRPTRAGDNKESTPPWSENGSFLVIRRLKQDVPLFEQQMEEMAQSIRGKNNVDITADTLMAKCVGRWKDGTPLTVSPDGPDGDVSGDNNRINNFSFVNESDVKVQTPQGEQSIPAVEEDVIGNKCPHFAHIRKINPRQDGTDKGREDTLSRLILRRGIPFGEQYDGSNADSERGLLFMCYQSSISEQFEFLQKNWANAFNRPSGGGHDFIIGQPDKSHKAAEFPYAGQRPRVISSKEWVFTAGGEYLFAPGKKELQTILSEATPLLKNTLS